MFGHAELVLEVRLASPVQHFGAQLRLCPFVQYWCLTGGALGYLYVFVFAIDQVAWNLPGPLERS